MNSWIRFVAPLICRVLGHTDPVWKPLYRAWSGPDRVESGQCGRCWRVIAERSMTTAVPYWHGQAPAAKFTAKQPWPWE